MSTQAGEEAQAVEGGLDITQLIHYPTRISALSLQKFARMAADNLGGNLNARPSLRKRLTTGRPRKKGLLIKIL